MRAVLKSQHQIFKNVLTSPLIKIGVRKTHLHPFSISHNSICPSKEVAASCPSTRKTQLEMPSQLLSSDLTSCSQAEDHQHTMELWKTQKWNVFGGKPVRSACWWCAAFPVRSRPPSAARLDSEPHRMDGRKRSTPAHWQKTGFIWCENNNPLRFCPCLQNYQSSGRPPLLWKDAEDDSITWFLLQHYCCYSDTRPPALSLSPAAAEPRSEWRSATARWEPAGWKQPATWRAWRRGAAGNPGNPPDAPQAPLGGQTVQTLASGLQMSKNIYSWAIYQNERSTSQTGEELSKTLSPYKLYVSMMWCTKPWLTLAYRKW